MAMNTKVIVGGVVVVLLIIGAMYFMSKDTSTPADGEQQAQAAASTAAASSTLGQVQGQDVSIGTGVEAKPGDIVSVLYVGKLQDGTVFDSSEAHGGQPLKFALGTNELIPGFQIGVNGMKVGGERVLAIPPALGYGDKDVTDPATSKVIVPANSTILFNVKLVAVEPGTTTPAQQ
ncbi:MAG TPA: FKBP-type peptidyl-prolyl cis-trans isomerase [Candidatus Paceibacterota bacterium]